MSEPETPAEGVAAPHVVMIVANDVVTDTRVRKTAVSLARTGVRVTVVGYASDGKRSESALGPATIVRVPIPWGLRDAAARRKARRRRLPIRLGYRDTADLAAARARLTLAERELKAATGRALVRREGAGALGPLAFKAGVAWRRGRAMSLRARRFVIAGRAKAQPAVERRYGTLWSKLDGAVGRVGVGARWESILPLEEDYELAFGPVIDQLAPDVIHAHDMHMVGVAARAVARARLRGRAVRWVYDAHEFVPGLSQYGGRTRRVIAAWTDLERQFIGDADRVLTVCEPLADELAARYRLRQRPAVVMNIPPLEPERAVDPSAPSLRESIGLAEGVPLLVYSGGVQHARGIQTAVAALAELPQAHLAVVCVPHTRLHFVKVLTTQAQQAGVTDRVHFVEPVPPDQVSAFLSSADVGLIPLLHFGSHEFALTNKLFEYVHGGIPVVVSDCRAQAEFVRTYGVGEVHPAQDATALAAAVRSVLSDRARYVAAIASADDLRTTFTWQAQERALWEFYRELLGDAVGEPVEVENPLRERPVGVRERRGGAPHLLVGPANMAGQGWAWAKAVEAHLPGCTTEVVAVEKPTLNFPADQIVTPAMFARDGDWQVRHQAHVLDAASHVLLEAGRPILGTLHGKDFSGDVPVLRAAGIAVALVFHGSEIRDPRRHAQLYPFSPFTDPDEELTARLQGVVDRLAPLVAAFDGPTFVSTPDLLDDVPGAQWLPVVVDTNVWAPGPEPLLTRDVPVVVHAPSNKALKGTHLIEPVLHRLAERGVIDYRRAEGIPPGEMPEFLAQADIVLDHFGIGNYGVMTCQAMAMGKVSVSHIHERVRARVPEAIPTIEATPTDLERVLTRILDDREWARDQAAQGPSFVARYHDGGYSAQVLAGFLGLSGADAHQAPGPATQAASGR